MVVVDGGICRRQEKRIKDTRLTSQDNPIYKFSKNKNGAHINWSAINCIQQWVDIN